jgi:hypothetical protein
VTRAARAALLAMLALAGFAALPGPARAQAERELVADATAQAFTLRASADMGGAATLPFYFGSYADATLTSPPPGADGQASFYNLGIAETALFTPPGGCTPEEQQKRIQSGIEDMTSWISNTAIPALQKGDVPVLPIPTLPCSERFPGFAQSRYPATETIPASSQHDLMGSALCGANACDAAGALASLSGGVFHGGRFIATSTDAPSQTSDATIVGIDIPGVVSIGAARSLVRASVQKERLLLRSTWTATDVCIAPSATGDCGLAIGSIRQSATLERDATGKVVTRRARTVFAGVEGGGQTQEISVDDLQAGLPPIDLRAPDDRGRLLVRAVSSTGGCGDPGKPDVADAGGLEIFGKGQGTGVSLPLPLVGTANGGGILLGGACAAGRLAAVSFELPGFSSPGSGAIPGRTVVIPNPPGAVPPTVGGLQLSTARVVRKSLVHYALRRAPVLRTARWWATILSLLIQLGVVAFMFRRSRVVAPAATAVDRFTRQFVRG